MIIRIISYQKARALCNRIAGVTSLPAAGEAYLLARGCKLANAGGKYVVYGYADDNSDILAFCRDNGIE